MKNYYYIGSTEFTVWDFTNNINQDTYDKSRLFEVNDTIICNTESTWSIIIHDNQIYHLRCNVIKDNMNILCYYCEN